MIYPLTKKRIINPCKISKRAMIILIVFLTQFFFAQSPVPRYEWKNATYRDKDLQNQSGLTQVLSGDEWWYSHKTLFSGTVQIGYVAVGYLADLVHPGDETKIRTAFNEGTDSPFNPYPSTGSLFTYTIGGNPPSHFDGSCDEFYNIYSASTNTTIPIAEDRAKFRGMLARLDMRGNMTWCRLPNISGDGLQDLTIDGSSNIYVVGIHEGAKSTSLSNKQFIPYNPISLSTATANVFNKSLYPALTSTSGSSHMYVAKYNPSGSKVWEGLYGDYNFSGSSDVVNAWAAQSQGWDILYNSDGYLYAVGVSATSTNSSSFNNLFIVKIDPGNGFVMTHTTLPLPTVTNTFSESVLTVIGRSICQIDGSGNMAVGGICEFNNSAAHGYVEQRKGLVYGITPTLTPLSWSLNPVVFSNVTSTTSTYKNSNIWEINYHAHNNEILVGLINNCDGCIGPGNNYGEGEIYRLEPTTGTMSSMGSTNPSTMGIVNAYDLRLGVIETSDHGFAAISAKRNPNVFTLPTSTDLGVYANCSHFADPTFTSPPYEQTSEHFGYWDTDPLIVKFDELGNKEWEWSEDIVPGRSRELAGVGDCKRQECMYKISETGDGGLAVSGNCSMNHDDNYMVKLYSDCNELQTYNPSAGITMTASSTTWNSSMKVKGKVVIPSGKTLNISGAITIEFADSRSCGMPTYIEVQKGGTLNVVGGATLTSIDKTVCSGSMWEGIYVLGTSTLSQANGNQGVVIINGATISNARTAITTGTSYANGGFNWGSMGGVIIGFNSNFINNNRDIAMLAYQSPTSTSAANLSYFKGCHFLTTAELNDYSNPIGHVSLYAVNGIKFQGCEFAYNAGSVSTPTAHGYGILSSDANFIVEDLCGNSACTTYTQNAFNNLAQGIFVANSNSLKSVDIKHAIFTCTSTNATDPISGILLSSSNQARVQNCTFNMDDPYAEGIFLNNCANYSVRNNTLTGGSGAQGVGIRVSSSRGGNHEIYRNTFSSHWIDIQSQFENTAYPTSTNINNFTGEDGLKMNCNVFNGASDYNITVLGYNASGWLPAVAQNQGIVPLSGVDPTKLVRNTYSTNCTDANNWNTDPASTKIIKHANHSEAYTIPSCGSTLLNINTTGSNFNFATDCDALGFRPVTNPSCPCPSCCKYADISLDLSNKIYNTNTLTSHYNSLIDGGETQNLLDAINSGTLSNTALKDLLVNESPYLSDTVLKTYFSKSTVTAAYAVLVHNQNKPVTFNIWQSILNRSFSGAAMDSMTARQSYYKLSYRAALEDELSNSKGQLQFVYTEKIGYFLSDTMPGAADTIIKLYSQNLGNLRDAAEKLVDAYANGGYYTRAFAYADSLKSIPEYEEKMILKLALLQLDTASSKMYKVLTNSVLLEIIQDYASDSSKVGYYNARAVLKQVYNTDMHLVRLSIEGGGGARTTNNSNEDTDGKYQNPSFSNVNVQSSLNIFPNPTNGNFKMLYTNPNEIESTYYIHDVLGKEFASGVIKTNTPQEIDTQLFNNGIYFVTLVQSNKLVGVQKIIIMK